MVIYGTIIPSEGMGDEMIAITSALLISFISFKAIETPLRYIKWGFIEGAIATVAAGGTVLTVNNHVNENKYKLNYENFSSINRNKLESVRCHSPKFKDALEKCLEYKKTNRNQNIILIGDSHAGHLGNTYGYKFTTSNWKKYT